MFKTFVCKSSMKDKLELEFFKQEKIDEDYADKISIVLQMIDLELKQ